MAQVRNEALKMWIAIVRCSYHQVQGVVILFSLMVCFAMVSTILQMVDVEAYDKDGNEEIFDDFPRAYLGDDDPFYQKWGTRTYPPVELSAPIDYDS